MDNEGIVELRAIREEMAAIGNRPIAEMGMGIATAISELANAIRTLAFHIELLERKVK